MQIQHFNWPQNTHTICSGNSQSILYLTEPSHEKTKLDHFNAEYLYKSAPTIILIIKNHEIGKLIVP